VGQSANVQSGNVPVIPSHALGQQVQSQVLLDKAADIDSDGSEDFEEPPD